MAAVKSGPRRARFERRHPVILVLAGTRPECIKLAPVIWALSDSRLLHPVVVNSGQHAEMVERTFQEFGITPDFTLPALPTFSRLGDAYDHVATEIAAVLDRLDPDLVVVQGDTLTAYAGARVASRSGYPVAHVEAGLRTDAPREPYPEEWFRRQIAHFADFHFAPCKSAVDNLRAEGMPNASIYHVGNTGIDSLAWMLGELGHDPARARPSQRLVLITLHRRENWDHNAEMVCDSLLELGALRPDLHMVFPVHPNPRVAEPVRRRLAQLAQCALVGPMSYRQFIQQAGNAALIISDSGGIQEEAPHLGTPLLVPRSNTERPEAVVTGFVRIVAVRPGAIVPVALELLAAPRRAVVPFDDDAPFGAGDAALRIAGVLQGAFRERARA